MVRNKIARQMRKLMALLGVEFCLAVLLPQELVPVVRTGRRRTGL